MSSFYVFVDRNQKKILSPVQKLPENWNNINGLNDLDDEKLKDLSWAGHSAGAWIPYNSSDLAEYSCDEECFKMSKINIISEISKNRKDKSVEVLHFNAQKIKLDLETKILLLLTKSNNKDESRNIPWIFLDQVIILSKKEFSNLYNFVTFYLQDCLEVEIKFNQKINSVTSFSDLQKTNLDVEWPSTTYAKQISFFDLLEKVLKDLKALIIFIFGINR